jgi:hypothetical protein
MFVPRRSSGWLRGGEIWATRPWPPSRGDLVVLYWAWPALVDADGRGDYLPDGNGPVRTAQQPGGRSLISSDRAGRRRGKPGDSASATTAVKAVRITAVAVLRGGGPRAPPSQHRPHWPRAAFALRSDRRPRRGRPYRTLPCCPAATSSSLSSAVGGSAGKLGPGHALVNRLISSPGGQRVRGQRAVDVELRSTSSGASGTTTRRGVPPSIRDRASSAASAPSRLVGSERVDRRGDR